MTTRMSSSNYHQPRWFRYSFQRGKNSSQRTERAFFVLNRAGVSALAPCSHEEADSRMIIHAFDASLNGFRRIMIQSNDTDVVVLAVSIAQLLPLDELWISYGSSKHVRILPAHAIATSLGREKTCVLLMFHALT
ncbi:uncharacterized protein LOC144639911 [Oculina patagonica]